MVQTALKDKAIEPQVIVTVTSSPSTFVTMAGDVGIPGQLPLALGGSRLLDAIVGRWRAEGSLLQYLRDAHPQRRQRDGDLGEFVRDPRQNIYLQPIDLIYVNVDPQVYMAFGATSRNATVPFKHGPSDSAEAVGQAGGLSDLRADPRGVFVFRYEDPDIYAAIRAIQPDALGSPSTTSAGVPVVYKMDMDDPQPFSSRSAS